MVTEKLEDVSNRVLIISIRNNSSRGTTVCFNPCNLLILFGIRKNCINNGRRQSLYIYRKDDEMECSNCQCTPLLPTTYKIFIQHSSLKVDLICRYVGHQCGFWCNRSIIITYSVCVKYLYLRKNRNRMGLFYFIDFKKAYVRLGGRFGIIFALSLV
jgi:hypothetical protein